MAYSLTLPDGTVVDGIADKYSREEALSIIRQKMPQSFAQQQQQRPTAESFFANIPNHVPPPVQKSGIGASFKGGIESLLSSSRTGVEAITGNAAEAAQAGLQRDEQIGAEYKKEVGLDLIAHTYRNNGLTAAAREVMRQFPHILASQAPQIALTIAGAKVGAITGAAITGPAAPIGATVGAIVGGAGALMPQYIGANVERQAAAQQAAGETIDPSVATAAGVGAVQAGLDFASLKMLGGTIIGKWMGMPGGKLSDEALKAVASRSLKASAGVGAGKGLIEIPTEVAQQILERAQAGLPLTNDEALAEYGESAYQAGVLGPSIGTVGGMMDRSSAKSELQAREQQRAAEAKKKELEERAALEATPEWQNSVEGLTARFNKVKKDAADLSREMRDLGDEGDEGAVKKTLTDRHKALREQQKALWTQIEEAKKSPMDSFLERATAESQTGAKPVEEELIPIAPGVYQTRTEMEADRLAREKAAAKARGEDWVDPTAFAAHYDTADANDAYLMSLTDPGQYAEWQRKTDRRERAESFAPITPPTVRIPKNPAVKMYDQQAELLDDIAARNEADVAARLREQNMAAREQETINDIAEQRAAALSAAETDTLRGTVPRTLPPTSKKGEPTVNPEATLGMQKQRKGAPFKLRSPMVAKMVWPNADKKELERRKARLVQNEYSNAEMVAAIDDALVLLRREQGEIAGQPLVTPYKNEAGDVFDAAETPAMRQAAINDRRMQELLILRGEFAKGLEAEQQENLLTVAAVNKHYAPKPVAPPPAYTTNPNTVQPSPVITPSDHPLANLRTKDSRPLHLQQRAADTTLPGAPATDTKLVEGKANEVTHRKREIAKLIEKRDEILTDFIDLLREVFSGTLIKREATKAKITLDRLNKGRGFGDRLHDEINYTRWENDAVRGAQASQLLDAVATAKNRQEYVDAVRAIGEALNEGDRITDQDTGVVWTIRKATAKDGTEGILFEVKGGNGEGNFGFQRQQIGPWMSVGELSFPARAEITVPERRFVEEQTERDFIKEARTLAASRAAKLIQQYADATVAQAAEWHALNGGGLPKAQAAAHKGGIAATLRIALKKAQLRHEHPEVREQSSHDPFGNVQEIEAWVLQHLGPSLNGIMSDLNNMFRPIEPESDLDQKGVEGVRDASGRLAVGTDNRAPTKPGPDAYRTGEKQINLLRPTEASEALRETRERGTTTDQQRDYVHAKINEALRDYPVADPATGQASNQSDLMPVEVRRALEAAEKALLEDFEGVVSLLPESADGTALDQVGTQEPGSLSIFAGQRKSKITPNLLAAIERLTETRDPLDARAVQEGLKLIRDVNTDDAGQAELFAGDASEPQVRLVRPNPFVFRKLLNSTQVQKLRDALRPIEEIDAFFTEKLHDLDMQMGGEMFEAIARAAGGPKEQIDALRQALDNWKPMINTLRMIAARHDTALSGGSAETQIIYLRQQYARAIALINSVATKNIDADFFGKEGEYAGVAEEWGDLYGKYEAAQDALFKAMLDAKDEAIETQEQVKQNLARRQQVLGRPTKLAFEQKSERAHLEALAAEQKRPFAPTPHRKRKLGAAWTRSVSEAKLKQAVQEKLRAARQKAAALQKKLNKSLAEMVVEHDKAVEAAKQNLTALPVQTRVTTDFTSKVVNVIAEDGTKNARTMHSATRKTTVPSAEVKPGELAIGPDEKGRMTLGDSVVQAENEARALAEIEADSLPDAERIKLDAYRKKQSEVRELEREFNELTGKLQTMESVSVDNTSETKRFDTGQLRNEKLTPPNASRQMPVKAKLSPQERSILNQQMARVETRMLGALTDLHALAEEVGKALAAQKLDKALRLGREQARKDLSKVLSGVPNAELAQLDALSAMTERQQGYRPTLSSSPMNSTAASLAAVRHAAENAGKHPAELPATRPGERGPTTPQTSNSPPYTKDMTKGAPEPTTEMGRKLRMALTGQKEGVALPPEEIEEADAEKLARTQRDEREAAVDITDENTDVAEDPATESVLAEVVESMSFDPWHQLGPKVESTRTGNKEALGDAADALLTEPERNTLDQANVTVEQAVEAAGKVAAAKTAMQYHVELAKAVQGVVRSLQNKVKAIIQKLAAGMSSFIVALNMQFAPPVQLPPDAALPTTTTITSQVKQANFGGHAVTPSIKKLADGILTSNRHGGKPFIIVDKPNAKLYAFDHGGTVISTAPALLGKYKGDAVIPPKKNAWVEQDRVTPAGVFRVSQGPEASYGNVLWVDGTYGVAVHKLYTGEAGEARPQRLASPVPDDNRISWGCINVAPTFYDNVLGPTFAKTDGTIFITPDSMVADAQLGVPEATERVVYRTDQTASGINDGIVTTDMLFGDRRRAQQQAQARRKKRGRQDKQRLKPSADDDAKAEGRRKDPPKKPSVKLRVPASESTVDPGSKTPVYQQNLARIIHPDSPGWLQSMLKNVWGLTARTMFVDRAAPLTRIAGKMQDSLRALQMMHFVREADRTNMHVGNVMSHGPITVHEKQRPDGRTEYIIQGTDGANINQLLAALKGEDFRTFASYIALERAETIPDGYNKLFGRTGVQPMTQQQIQEALAYGRNNGAFQNARKIYHDFNKGLIEFAVKTGFLRPDAVAKMLDGKDFIPYYRQDPNGDIWLEGEHPIKIGNLRETVELAALYGSDKDLRDPFANIARNARMLIGMSLRNIAAKNTAYTLQELGLGVMAKGRLNGRATTGKNIIHFMQHGLPQAFSVETEGDEVFGDVPADLLVKGMEGIATQLPQFIRLLGVPSNFLRAMITRNPLYSFRQLTRDPAHAWLTTGIDTASVLKGMARVGPLMAGRDETGKLLRERGLLGGQVYQGTDEDIGKILAEVQAGQGGLAKFVHWLDTMSVAADASTRVAIYEDLKYKKGMTDLEATMGTMESVNFATRGASPGIQMINMLVPFFNAQIQGLDSVYRAMTGQMPFNDRLKARRKLAQRSIIMAASTMAYYAMVQDEEWYKNTPENVRLTHWMLPPMPMFGIEEPIKIPIPFELGLMFKALPESVFMASEGDSQAEAVWSSIWTQLKNTVPGGSSGMPPIPAAFKPLYEVQTNHSFFTGRGIVPTGLEGAAPENQVSVNNTQLAREIGGALGMSPMHIEHLVRGYTSGLGFGLFKVMDGILTPTDVPRPEGRPSQLPFIGPLFQPVDGSAVINRAYNEVAKIEAAKRRFKEAREQGRTADAQAIWAEDRERIGGAKYAGWFRQRMGQITDYEQRVWASKTMGPAEKEAALRWTRQQKIELAKRLEGAT